MITYCFYISIYSGLFTVLDRDRDGVRVRDGVGVRDGVRIFGIRYPPLWVFLAVFLAVFLIVFRCFVAILYNTPIF